MSGYSVALLLQGYDAAAAINKFTAVKFSAEGVVTPATAATDLVAGVAMNSVSTAEQAAGKGVSVMCVGIAEMEVGTGGIAFGGEVSIDSSGKAIPAVSTARIIGQCVRGATVGQRGAVLLNIPGNIKP